MSKAVEDITASEVDPKQISSLIVDLNIARRNSRSYPSGHPLVEAAYAKAAETCLMLLRQRSRIMLGITRDALMLDGSLFDAGNPVCRDFARLLFEHGIATLEFNSGLTRRDVEAFTTLMALKREEVLSRGGIETVWQESGPAAIAMQPIHYELFQAARDGGPEGADPLHPDKPLWEQLILSLTTETHDFSSPAFGQSDLDIVAERLNRSCSFSDQDRSLVLSGQISSLLKECVGNATDRPGRSALALRLATLLEKLSPDVRAEFIAAVSESTVDPSSDRPFAMEIVPHLSPKTLVAVIEHAKARKRTLPPLVMGLIRKIGASGSEAGSGLNGEDVQDDSERVKSLFREHASEEYIPDDYQKKLDTILSLDGIPECIADASGLEPGDFEPRTIETSLGGVVLHIVTHMADEGDDTTLLETLGEMFTAALMEGQYEDAVRLLEKSLSQHTPERTRKKLAVVFAASDNIGEIMTGLKTLGKTCYPQAGTLIRMLGTPCIAPLLDSLADEASMSLRRFMMERIIEFGESSREEILKRLSDPRWYYVRNLTVMLRQLGDPTAAPRLHALLDHANEKVRQEAMRTLLNLKDQTAERRILKDLTDNRRDVRLAALSISSACGSAEIIGVLSRIAMKSGTSKEDYEEREAAVSALAEGGAPQVIPLLGSIFSSRNLLAPRLHLKLKISCLAALEKNFPASLVRPLASHLLSERGDLGVAAAAVVARLEEKSNG